MSITFRGTYRDLGSFSASGGHPAAAGTVTITPAGGSTTEETLDGSGQYEVTLSSFSGKVTVVEDISGLDDEITTVYEVIDRTTTDTSKDIHIPTGPGDLPDGAYATPGYVNSAISALSGTFVDTTTAQTKAGILTFRDGLKSRTVAGDTGNGYIIMKAVGDLAAGVIDWMHNGDYGYLLHFRTGPLMTATWACVGIGVDEGGIGIHIGNKKAGVGMRIINEATITTIGAYGFYGEQNSAQANLVYISQAVAGVKPALVLTALEASAGQKLCTWRYNTGPGTDAEGGYVRADTGDLWWNRDIGLANTKPVKALNAAGNATRTLIALNASDQVVVGDVANANAMNFETATGGSYLFRTNANTRVTIDVNGITLADNRMIVLGTASGSMLGTGATQKLGFWGATPGVRPSFILQTYATADKTHAARTATAVATTAATQTTPYGYSTQAQADDIITQLNALRVDQLDTAQLLNAVIDDFQTMGLLG